jgi:hypothetical protein
MDPDPKAKAANAPGTPADLEKLIKRLVGGNRERPLPPEGDLKKYQDILSFLLQQLGAEWLWHFLSEGLPPQILVPRQGGIYRVSNPLPVTVDTNNTALTHKLQLWRISGLGSPVKIWPGGTFFDIPSAEWVGQVWTRTPVPASTMTAFAAHELRLFVQGDDVNPVHRFAFVPLP